MILGPICSHLALETFATTGKRVNWQQNAQKWGGQKLLVKQRRLPLWKKHHPRSRQPPHQRDNWIIKSVWNRIETKQEYIPTCNTEVHRSPGGVWRLTSRRTPSLSGWRTLWWQVSSWTDLSTTSIGNHTTIDSQHNQVSLWNVPLNFCANQPSRWEETLDMLCIQKGQNSFNPSTLSNSVIKDCQGIKQFWKRNIP